MPLPVNIGAHCKRKSIVRVFPLEVPDQPATLPPRPDLPFIIPNPDFGIWQKNLAAEFDSIGKRKKFFTKPMRKNRKDPDLIHTFSSNQIFYNCHMTRMGWVERPAKQDNFFLRFSHLIVLIYDG